MAQAIRLVFSNYQYVILAVAIFVGFLIPLSIISEYIFLEPYVIGHIPQGYEFAFSLIVIVSALSGLVIPMNVFRIIMMRTSKRKMSGSVFGSFIGITSPDNAETITINEKANSYPCGMCPIT